MLLQQRNSCLSFTAAGTGTVQRLVVEPGAECIGRTEFCGAHAPCCKLDNQMLPCAHASCVVRKHSWSSFIDKTRRLRSWFTGWHAV